MRWMLVLVVLAECRSTSAPASAPPAPARVPIVSRPPPMLTPELVVVEALPWVDPDEPKIGAIAGVVVQPAGEPLAGVTVIVSGEGMKGAHTAITEEDGVYVIEDLPPDDYIVTLYFGDQSFERPATVGDDLVELSDMTIDPDAPPAVEVHLSFSCGGGTMQNTYFVDGIDTTGLTFE